MARVPFDFPPSIARSLIRSFTGAWCVMVAALPIIAAEFGLAPIYESQRRILPACGAFFCLLGFAYVFSLRHGLGRAMFITSTMSRNADARHHRVSINQLLAGVILASIGAAAVYLWAFESGRTSPTFPQLPRSSAHAVVLALSYVMTFVFAEAAFAVMAVREYCHDVMGLTDAEAIGGQPPAANKSHSASIAFSYRVVPLDTPSIAESQFESELSIAERRRHGESADVDPERQSSSGPARDLEGEHVAALRG